MGHKYDERDRAYIKINLENLEHNAKVLQEAMPQQCRLMAVVKANAYGHGICEVSSNLEKIGIREFAVATIDEGIKLREHGIKGNILILGYTGICRAAELKKYDLTQTLIDFDYASALNEQNTHGAAHNMIKAHIKIDTGMHRLGIDRNDLPNIKKIFAMKNIKVCGIYTHLCCSESLEAEDVAYTKKQIDDFYGLLDALEDSGIPIPKIHIQSSYGLWNYPELKCDYVRAGVALYGVLSSPDDRTKIDLDLRPVLSLKTKIVLIRLINAGESVGYDRKFKAGRDSRIAMLPVGYGDGIPRNLSCGKGRVIVRGQYAPIVGMICMDQMAVDVTDIEDTVVGDTVTLIGEDGNARLSAADVADLAGSISNELLCRMGERLPVVSEQS